MDRVSQATQQLEKLNLNIAIPANELKTNRFIASGNYGDVYEGEWQNKIVAIKKLKITQMTPQAESEFKNEAVRAMQLSHPNVVVTYGVQIDSVPYALVMEFMSNGNLFAAIHSAGRVQWTEHLRTQIAQGIAYGLDYMHSHKIIHRDLKSLNILLDSDWQPKISDFGLATVRAQTISSSSVANNMSAKKVVGTIPWIAPEIFLSLRPSYTEASDVYAFGMILWEIYSGLVPYEQVPDVSFIKDAVKSGQREDIPTNAPIHVKNLIITAWGQDAKSRPSAKQMAIALTHSNTTSITYPNNFDTNTDVKFPSSNYPGNFDSVAVVNPADVAKLLRLVAEGEQDQAEALIKAEPALLLARGDVTDLSQRKFENITAFQYAVWALDWHMWDMILKNLEQLPNGKAQAQDQAKQFETGAWVGIYGVTVNWQNVIVALEELRENKYHNQQLRPTWSDAQCEKHWINQVGGGQLFFPAHVVNEYCRPIIDDLTNFPNQHLPRFRQTDKGEWFFAVRTYGAAISSMVASHGRTPRLAEVDSCYIRSEKDKLPCWSGSNPGFGLDISKLSELLAVRTSQRTQLLASLENANTNIYTLKK